MCRVSQVIPAGVNQLQLLSLTVMSITWSLSRHVVAHDMMDMTGNIGVCCEER